MKTSKSKFRFHTKKCRVRIFQQKLQEMEEVTSEYDASLCMLVQLNKELVEIHIVSKNTRGVFSLV